MRNNEGPKSASAGRVNRFIPKLLRIVSSGASTVARSAASVASSIVDRDDDGVHDQVLWAGFDKLKVGSGIDRRVLLIGYRSGFQVWDVQEADNVRALVSRRDGPVSFMQMVPYPTSLEKGEGHFVESRPLLVVCADGSGGTNSFQDGFTTHTNEDIPNVRNDQGNITFLPNIVRFYSLRSHTYVHVLKFRSVVYSVRCSGRFVVISQAAQIHCLDARTLQSSYTIITNPIVSGSLNASGCVGYGPLAVGPRWVAYSGIEVSNPDAGHVIPKQFTSSASFSGFNSNGSLVAHYAKESSKQLAAGIVNLGDMGYKKLSRYYSSLQHENSTLHTGDSGLKMVNGHLQDGDHVGMVVVKDIVSKSVVAQFRAHKSPISALCFDPSGTLLVTASIQGHNINVFKIMPGSSNANKSYMHLYQLQRGLTNAVIQDISFSDDSRWIMISSSKGTSHLFYINPEGGPINFQNPVSGSSPKISNPNFLCAMGPPITLTAVSRIRNGNGGWKGTVSGAAAAATGRLNSFPGAVASVFHECKRSESFGDRNSQRTKFHLLVFSPPGCMIQYALKIPNGDPDSTVGSGNNSPYDGLSDSDGKLFVEPTQKWNVSQKQNWRETEESLDAYGASSGNFDCKKIYPEGINKGNSFFQGVGQDKSKFKSNGEEHHLYMSEAELQMHPSQIPLQAKPGIQVYFQSMSVDGIELDAESTLGGEFPIEMIPARTLEAKSKDLVPLFDHLQASEIQTRAAKLEKPKVSHETGPHKCIKEAASHGHLMPQEEIVNNSATTNPEAQLVTSVNNREKSMAEVPLETVNSNEEEGLGMENHFEEKDNDFD